MKNELPTNTFYERQLKKRANSVIFKKNLRDTTLDYEFSVYDDSI
jgi:hypothetical protein